jgi:hypothetical protein
MKAKDINSNSKLILCYLLSYTGSGATCFPSIELISNDLSVSKRTVIRCIGDCIKSGYITKEQIQRGRGIGKQNIYHIKFMEGYASDKMSRAKNASDNMSVASDKIDTLQVTPRNCNNNNNNNIYNNNNNTPNKSGVTEINTLYHDLLDKNGIVYKPAKGEYINNANQYKKYVKNGMTHDTIISYMTAWFDQGIGAWCGYKLGNFWGDIGKMQINGKGKKKSYKEQQIAQQLAKYRGK